MNNQFPDPSPETKDHSQKLIALIAEKISEHGGKISFAEYMQLALYTPGFGYYSAGLRKFGREGDFVTAPEISPLFSQCLAQQCQQVLSQMAKGSILEFGAGTGIMAADILNELERLNSLPEHYYILEISPELQQRQRETLARSAPQYAKRVTWLDQLPHDFRGIMLANEVLDAMPVERFHIESHEIQQYFVGFDRGQFYWQLSAPDDKMLANRVRELSAEFFPNAANYDTEINPILPAWIQSIAGCLAEGAIWIGDYGFPRHEYYHPDRTMGTLMCHYRHRVHDDPLILTGLQDITAHVDFTTVAENAVAAGLEVAGFTNQAFFLLSCGITDRIHAQTTQEQIAANQAVKQLTSPSEMGELIKVMMLTKNIDVPLLGFKLQDWRRRL